MPAQPSNLTETARQRVEQLFAGRRGRARLHASTPEWYTQAEPNEPQAFPGGYQVRVRTWRHWSDAYVHLDAEDGGVLHVSVDRLSAPPTDVELTEAEALAIAARLIDIPADAELVSFRHEEFADGGHRVARLDWRHMHRGLRVDGDYLWVAIHPTTQRLVAMSRKWRTLTHVR